MINKRNEISVCEKQGHPALNAESSDDDIHCFADGDSLLAKRSVVLCTLLWHALAKHLESVQHHQCLFSLTVLPVVPYALKNFEKNQITIATVPSTIPESSVSVCLLRTPLR